MQRLGGVAIHMPLNSDRINFVVGNREILEGMREIRALNPFDERVIEFFNSLAGKLRSNRAFPDVATFAFWCRGAALKKEKTLYDDIDERLGKGVIFHVAPSNVPVNFAFSFAAGLLAGNANIVRLSGKEFPQIDIICSAINELLAEDYGDLAPYMCFIRYEHDKEITDALSYMSHVRVVWGGDQTIAEFRKSPLPPRSTEINFADRHSLAVINAEEYLHYDKKDGLVRDFYNDTYYTDQNACTSPRIVMWQCKDKEKILQAKNDFWDRVHNMLTTEYDLAAVQAVGKLHALYKAASKYEIAKESAEDMLITRMDIDSIDEDLMDYKYNSGFFFEKDIESLSEMIPVCTNPCQTVGYFGVDKDEIRSFIRDCRPKGVDRFVPIGKTMDFALIWDGYDLIRGMSRRITII